MDRNRLILLLRAIIDQAARPDNDEDVLLAAETLAGLLFTLEVSPTHIVFLEALSDEVVCLTNLQKQYCLQKQAEKIRKNSQ